MLPRYFTFSFYLVFCVSTKLVQHSLLALTSKSKEQNSFWNIWCAFALIICTETGMHRGPCNNTLMQQLFMQFPIEELAAVITVWSNIAWFEGFWKEILMFSKYAGIEGNLEAKQQGAGGPILWNLKTLVIAVSNETSKLCRYVLTQ